MSCTQIGSYFCDGTSVMMREYMTVHPNGILLRATTKIFSVTFFAFTGNPSAIRPNSFDILFCQRFLVFLLLAALNICTIKYTLCMYK